MHTPTPTHTRLQETTNNEAQRRPKEPLSRNLPLGSYTRRLPPHLPLFHHPYVHADLSLGTIPLGREVVDGLVAEVGVDFMLHRLPEGERAGRHRLLVVRVLAAEVAEGRRVGRRGGVGEEEEEREEEEADGGNEEAAAGRESPHWRRTPG